MKIRFTRSPPLGQFKVGDKVKWCGMPGIVATTNGPVARPIQVIFTSIKYAIGFLENGQFFEQPEIDCQLSFVSRGPGFKQRLVNFFKRESVSNGNTNQPEVKENQTAGDEVKTETV